MTWVYYRYYNKLIIVYRQTVMIRNACYRYERSEYSWPHSLHLHFIYTLVRLGERERVDMDIL